MELFLVKVPEEPDDDAPVEYEFRVLYRFEYDCRAPNARCCEIS